MKCIIKLTWVCSRDQKGRYVAFLYGGDASVCLSCNDKRKPQSHFQLIARQTSIAQNSSGDHDNKPVR